MVIHVSQRDGTQGDIRVLDIVVDLNANDDPIESERRIKAEKDAYQNQIFADILSNVDTTKVPYSGTVYRAVAGILLGFSLTGSITLLPWHNITDDADYW